MVARVFQRVPDAALIRLFYAYNSNPALQFINDFHFFVVGGFTPGDIDNLVAAAQTAVGDYLAGQIPLSAKMIRIEGRDLNVEAGYETSNSTGVAGTVNAEFSPPNNAILIRFITPSGGKPKSNWIFFPFITEADVDDLGVLASGHLTAVVNAIDSLTGAIAAGVGGTTVHCAVHRPKDRTLDAVTKPVSFYAGRPVVASMRRRRPPPTVV